MGSSSIAAAAVVAFLAVGTRGDVQPLAILAAYLAKKRGDVKVHFVTNRKHKILVEAPLTSAGVCSVEYLSLPPATPGTTENEDADQERRHRNASDEQHREVRFCVRLTRAPTISPRLPIGESGGVPTPWGSRVSLLRPLNAHTSHPNTPFSDDVRTGVRSSLGECVRLFRRSFEN